MSSPPKQMAALHTLPAKQTEAHKDEGQAKVPSNQVDTCGIWMFIVLNLYVCTM